jgi:hypothetical protein
VRCRLVETPYKDANECLQQGMDRAAFRDVIDAAKSLDPQELRSASTYADEVLARWRRALGRKGFPLVRAISELETHWNHFTPGREELPVFLVTEEVAF